MAGTLKATMEITGSFMGILGYKKKMSISTDISEGYQLLPRIIKKHEKSSLENGEQARKVGHGLNSGTGTVSIHHPVLLGSSPLKLHPQGPCLPYRLHSEGSI